MKSVFRATHLSVRRDGVTNPVMAIFVSAVIFRAIVNDLSLAESAGIAAIADGEAEVLRRVRERWMLRQPDQDYGRRWCGFSLRSGLDSLQFTETEIRAAVMRLPKTGALMSVHYVYTSAGIQRALACGVQSIEHGHCR